ncbi:hypothetical protein PFISCL1PPCAC_7660, partial [Pristionchus fissidentatus]
RGCSCSPWGLGAAASHRCSSNSSSCSPSGDGAASVIALFIIEGEEKGIGGIHPMNSTSDCAICVLLIPSLIS